ncbi:MAG: YHS domain-containing protein [Deltaproteobacteria bacterium]|nr:YHS domain-containing protein [Deltaproteobacteria bacterium]MBW2340473.1 YHS domain-containing protein [Deltaproteobacteria bacterium]
MTNAITTPIIDAVCGMRVEPGKTRVVSNHQGHTYWFCSEACREAFDKKPEKYLRPKKVRHKWPAGRWGRYLERMAKANEELFGGGPPSCH